MILNLMIFLTIRMKIDEIVSQMTKEFDVIFVNVAIIWWNKCSHWWNLTIFYDNYEIWLNCLAISNGFALNFVDISKIWRNKVDSNEIWYFLPITKIFIVILVDETNLMKTFCQSKKLLIFANCNEIWCFITAVQFNYILMKRFLDEFCHWHQNMMNLKTLSCWKLNYFLKELYITRISLS